MEIRETIKPRLRGNGIAVILITILAVDFLFLSVLLSDPKGGERMFLSEEPIPKISEISGSLIDSEAATDTYVVCTSLATEVWVVMLLALGALLIFNFCYGFTRGERLQWKWELAFVAVVLLVWYEWDSCREEIWFPFAVLKMSLIIFALYLVLLEKKEIFSNIPEEEYIPVETDY